jgi:hypothetical protein
VKSSASIIRATGIGVRNNVSITSERRRLNIVRTWYVFAA